MSDRVKKVLEKTQQYWQDRQAASQAKLTEKKAKETEQQLKKYYSDAMKVAINDFELTYEKILNAKAEGREPTPADLYKLDKYWEAQAQLRRELTKLGDRQIALLSKKFEENFFDIYYSIGIPSKKAFNTVDTSIAKQLINQIWCADGKTWSERVWTNIGTLQTTLNDELIHCVATGKKTSDLKLILQDRFNVSYNNADMIVRTELAQIQTTAAKQRYEDYGVEMVEVIADWDERRCPICADLHHKKFPVNGPMPVPAHPRCRCCIVPVVDDDDEEQITIDRWG